MGKFEEICNKLVALDYLNDSSPLPKSDVSDWERQIKQVTVKTTQSIPFSVLHSNCGSLTATKKAMEKTDKWKKEVEEKKTKTEEVEWEDTLEEQIGWGQRLLNIAIRDMYSGPHLEQVGMPSVHNIVGYVCLRLSKPEMATNKACNHYHKSAASTLRETPEIVIADTRYKLLSHVCQVQPDDLYKCWRRVIDHTCPALPVHHHSLFP